MKTKVRVIKAQKRQAEGIEKEINRLIEEEREKGYTYMDVKISDHGHDYIIILAFKKD